MRVPVGYLAAVVGAMLLSACPDPKPALSPCVGQLLDTLNTTDENKQSLKLDLGGLVQGQSLNAGWESEFKSTVDVTFQKVGNKQIVCSTLAKVTNCAITEKTPEASLNRLIAVLDNKCPSTQE